MAGRGGRTDGLWWLSYYIVVAVVTSTVPVSSCIPHVEGLVIELASILGAASTTGVPGWKVCGGLTGDLYAIPKVLTLARRRGGGRSTS